MQHSLECCVGRLLAPEPWALFPVTIQPECCFWADCWLIFVTALASWDGNTLYWLGCFPYILSTSLLYKFCTFPCYKGLAQFFHFKNEIHNLYPLLWFHVWFRFCCCFHILDKGTHPSFMEMHFISARHSDMFWRVHKSHRSCLLKKMSPLCQN